MALVSLKLRRVLASDGKSLPWMSKFLNFDPKIQIWLQKYIKYMLNIRFKGKRTTYLKKNRSKYHVSNALPIFSHRRITDVSEYVAPPERELNRLSVYLCNFQVELHS